MFTPNFLEINYSRINSRANIPLVTHKRIPEILTQFFLFWNYQTVTGFKCTPSRQPLFSGAHVLQSPGDSGKASGNKMNWALPAGAGSTPNVPFQRPAWVWWGCDLWFKVNSHKAFVIYVLFQFMRSALPSHKIIKTRSLVGPPESVGSVWMLQTVTKLPVSYVAFCLSQNTSLCSSFFVSGPPWNSGDS